MASMNRSRRIAALLVLAVALLVALGFALRLDWNDFRAPLAAWLSQRAQRDVVLRGDLEVRPGWPRTTVVAHDVALANVPAGRAPALFHAERVRVDVNLRRLLGGDLVLSLIRMDGPLLALEKDAEGRGNWQAQTPRDDTPDSMLTPEHRGVMPIIERLHIESGEITYRDVARDVDLKARLARVEGKADDAPGRIVIDGQGTLRGSPLRFTLRGADLDTLRQRHVPYPIEGALDAGSTHARIAGSVGGAARAASDVDLKLELRGRSAADLFPLTGIALLPTPPYRVSGQLRRGDRVWHFEDFSGHMGASDLRGSLRWDLRGPRPLLVLRCTSERLALADLGPLIGRRETPNDGRVLPEMPLRIERLAAMDADVEFDGLQVVATRMPLQHFHLRLLLRDGVLQLTPLSFASGAGAIETYATVDGTRDPPATNLRTTIRAVPIAPIFTSASKAIGRANLAAGTLEGHATLAGRGRSLRDMLAAADGRVRLTINGGQLSQIVIEMIGLDVAEATGFLLAGDEPVPIRCMLADFDARDGHLRPRALVLDTTDTVITGEGEIDLARERFDLRLRPEPKDFSPLSLRTPLTLEGSFADPQVGLAKRGLIMRGVAAAALAIAFPPAAIAALFEPGNGDDANCTVLLRESAP